MTSYNMDPTKGGIKHDDGKTQWHLLPLEAVEGAVRVMMHGAKKYSAYNWANGMPYTRVLDAAMRHINAIYQGEDKDPDSGLDHVDHAICELLFLKYYMIHKKGEDDRFKRGQPDPPLNKSINISDIKCDPVNIDSRHYYGNRDWELVVIPTEQTDWGV